MSGSLSQQWPWNPWAIAFLSILALLYLWGLFHMHKRGRSVSAWRIIAFFSALVVAALLLLTPIDTIGRLQLFSVHMTQIVILTTVCTPLIMAGCPEELLHPLVEVPILSNILLVITSPLIASVIFNMTFLLWHTPVLMGLAQANEALYHFMMLSIFFTSFLNWHPLIGSIHENQHMSYPVQMAYAFFDGQPVDILAFVLVFTQSIIYHYAIPAQLHISAFSDQATGGAILLAPGLVDIGVMTPLFFRWLWQIESRARLDDEKRQAEIEAMEEWEEVEEDEDEEIVAERKGGLEAF
jgi:cytochrome c oxidase assembly factor CtaG